MFLCASIILRSLIHDLNTIDDDEALVRGVDTLATEVVEAAVGRLLLSLGVVEGFPLQPLSPFLEKIVCYYLFSDLSRVYIII